MEWLLALLAFAGVMAILSTIVSAIVEAIHKFLALRRAGLEEMLRALHDTVLRDIAEKGDPQRGGRSQEAARFAKVMTRSPAFGGGKRWWWLRNLPIINIVFQPKFERLTTLQFVEQLGRTPVGQTMAQWDRERLRRAVHTAAFQFERFGQAQMDYFARRAKVISVLAAMSFVAAFNIDAIALYTHLAQSPETTGRTLAFFEAEGDDLQGAMTGLEQRLQSLSSAPASALTAAETDGVVAEMQALRASIDNAQSDLATLSALDLPVGPSMFPFCVGSGKQAAIDAMRLTNNLRERQQLCLDSLRIAIPWYAAAGQGDARDAALPNSFWARLTTQQGLIWLMSVIVTTGLIGLGAPFWFNVFRTLARIVGRERAAAAIDKAEQLSAERTRRRGQVRDPDAADIDTLTDSLLSASGRMTAGPAPVGRRAGRSSAEIVADQHGAPSAPGALPGMRQVRG